MDHNVPGPPRPATVRRRPRQALNLPVPPNLALMARQADLELLHDRQRLLQMRQRIVDPNADQNVPHRILMRRIAVAEANALQHRRLPAGLPPPAVNVQPPAFPRQNAAPQANAPQNPLPPARVRLPVFPRPHGAVPQAPQNNPVPAVPVQPVLPHPNRNQDGDVAEHIYQEVAKLLPDVNRKWILDRSGYELHRLVDYIFEHIEEIPVEPRRKSIDNLDNSQYEEVESDDVATDDDDSADRIATALIKFIRELKDEKNFSSRTLLPFLKYKYGNIKCATLNGLPQMDRRKAFAICALLDMRKLSRELAAEFQAALVWTNNPPWLIPSRARRRQAAVDLDPAWQPAFTLVEEAIENSKRNVALYACCVCYDDFSAKQIVACGDLETTENKEGAADTHYVCHECMRGQANALCSDGKLAEGGSGLCCLDPGCDRTIPWARVKVLLSKEVRHRLGKRLDNEALVNVDGLESCKRCSFAMLIETPVEIDKVFNCEKCKAEFCRICKYDWKPHIGKPCNEMKAVEDELEAKRRRLEDEMAMAIVRICHRCKLQFAKDEGCNKMTCRCGATQCYVCRALDITYNHFCQHVRDPGQANCPGNCTSCLLWEKTDEVNQKALEDIRQKALTDRNLQDIVNKL